MFEDRPSAKINLTLEVVGRRSDGYHELRSILLRIGLSDRLTMAPASDGVEDQLTVTGVAGAPPSRDNLVLRALDALRAQAGIDFPPLVVTLDKRIPAAAGLGGGSSDCASAIRLAQACWGVGLSETEELAVGTELGSDVPFFLSGVAAARIAGRGEFVDPLRDAAELGLLLVTPPIALSTARVFARYDDLESEPRVPAADLDTSQLIVAAQRLRDANDLWPAAASLEPSLPALRDVLEAHTSRPWMMSGSGPTLFALYASATEAAQAGQALVGSPSMALDGALINAVDLVGPDPTWRYS